MKTKNYSLFSFFNENRPIVRANVEQKKKSIKSIGYIEACPIIVNESFQIIDGQHRFIALKEMGMDIVYAIEDVNSQEAMIELNRSQSVWRLPEYINHFAEMGKHDYLILRNALNRHGKKLGTTAALSCYDIRACTSSGNIKKGTKININYNGEYVIEYLYRFERLPFYRKRAFVYAICDVYKKLSNDNLEKLVIKQMEIPEMASRVAYLSCFENILNYRMREQSKIKLT
jgi:hypothetical protein